MRPRTKTIVVFDGDENTVVGVAPNESTLNNHLATGWNITRQDENKGMAGTVVTLRRLVNYP